MIPTPSQTVGPFFGFGLQPVDGGGDMRIEGQVLDGSADPVSDALLEISDDQQFARCRTDEEGAFAFAVARPAVGFLVLTVFARGLLRHLTTRVYLPEAADAVPEEVEPARRHTLLARLEGEVFRFDVRLQGRDETVFFAPT